MIISAIDLETNSAKPPFITQYDSEEVVLNIFGTRKEILLPNCNESHEILGNWFLSNYPLKARILDEDIKVDITKYGHQADGSYITLPCLLYVAIPGWELIASDNPFTHEVSLYFRPLIQRRTKYASTTRMSF